jgi:hypothetical protein
MLQGALERGLQETGVFFPQLLSIILYISVEYGTGRTAAPWTFQWGGGWLRRLGETHSSAVGFVAKHTNVPTSCVSAWAIQTQSNMPVAALGPGHQRKSEQGANDGPVTVAGSTERCRPVGRQTAGPTQPRTSVIPQSTHF